MGLFEIIFGDERTRRRKAAAAAAKKNKEQDMPGVSRNTWNSSRVNAEYVPRKMKCAQVYEGRDCEIPDWAVGVNNTDMPKAIADHLVCKFVPHFGFTKIMSVNKGADGNLIPDFEGVAGDCGAIKNFGTKVAARDGQQQPYKYVDTKMAFRACCGIPKKCPFYMSALGEDESMNSRRK